MPPAWTAADIPDQTGRTVVVTGANTGIGYATAAALAGRGATVVLACRDLVKAERAAGGIRAAAEDADVVVAELDLGSLESVRAAAAKLRANHPRIDVLINNAGVLAGKRGGRTADGFEVQLGVNHLGHFALTGLLLDRLVATEGSRVVTVSSASYRFGRIHRDDLQLTGRQPAQAGYGQSKLAVLLFTFALQRRLAAAGASTIAVASHPGFARTEVARHYGAAARWFGDERLAWLTRFMAQPPEKAATSQLRAATDPSVVGGDFFGPTGPLQASGPPDRVRPVPRALDEDTAAWLWAESERLTGVTFSL